MNDPVMKFEIWWSPMGHENGKKIIDADSKAAAEKIAFTEMRKLNACGAWGANPIS